MNTNSLSLLTLNVEAGRHDDLIKPFLREHSQDVCCFQEMLETAFHEFKAEFSLEGFWVPSAEPRNKPEELKGSAILSHYPIKNYTSTEYDNFHEMLPEIAVHHPYRPRLWLQVAEIEKAGQLYRVATTHFTWSSSGEANDEQRANLKTLLTLTDVYKELVLVGDFNAPRGREIFDTLASYFTDNIPPEVTTTIDGARHRAGALPYVVDGMFSRGYTVTDVQVHDGLSDHCGVTGVIHLS
jgi:endonuclease/exonuclease/phosphatase family metal-dependent hydrolase